MIATPSSLATRRMFNKSTNQINVLCKCINSKEIVKRLNSCGSQNFVKINEFEPSSVEINDEIIISANIQLKDDVLLDYDVTLVAWSSLDEVYYFNLGQCHMDFSQYETNNADG